MHQFTVGWHLARIIWYRQKNSTQSL